MDKKDITYIVAAFCIILVVAFIIKPLATGEPVNTGLSLATPTPTLTSTPLIVYANITTLVTTARPTTTATWNQKAQTVDFVNPATYGVTTSQTSSLGTRINATVPDTSRTVYATISGKYSGTTQVVNIPFPYWELSYTIDPMIGQKSGISIQSTEVTPTLGQDSSYSGIQGSYASVSPEFSIRIMDASDPNRIVRTITPPGGIDPNLWAGVTPTTPENTRIPKYAETVATPTLSNTDPRPWTEKFYEGQRGYYFIINSRYLNSYTIRILVPTKYLGKY